MPSKDIYDGPVLLFRDLGNLFNLHFVANATNLVLIMTETLSVSFHYLPCEAVYLKTRHKDNRGPVHSGASDDANYSLQRPEVVSTRHRMLTIA